MKTILSPARLSSPFKYLLLLIFSSVAVSSNLQAQVNYKLNGSKDNLVKVSGKSNVHDWTMTAENPVCEASFAAFTAEESVPKSLTSLNFSVNAKNLKSESTSMNNRTYKAIKADAYPQITFKLREATVTPQQKNKFLVNATGTLTIAGVSKVISLQVNGDVKSDNTIVCSGQEKIKLTDYGIQPPSFMLGAMKVGNDLTIAFTLHFKK
ncbi:YceI family protein [Pedobacter sp. FW305-3-2-15-E-R2A2]|jgi:polyisoprenoid-binding protein YceI|uniref:YceI family protein n=1 Tax=Pedobacter sp. FW305-3-2-15-E-R2A2 TaxID=3140251 RepID=UPI0031404802